MANRQCLPKGLHDSAYSKFWLGREFVYKLNKIPNSPQENKLFFPNLYKLHNLYILTPKILINQIWVDVDFGQRHRMWIFTIFS
jgi:hypothetical protein